MNPTNELPPFRVVHLTEKFFTVSIKSALGTHWLESDQVLQKNLQSHCQSIGLLFTTGQIPLVTVTLEQSNTPVDQLLAKVKDEGGMV